MSYENCKKKGSERLEDDQSQEPKKDIFLSGYLIEFLDESFYCNKGKIELAEMIETIDWIDNLLTHNNGYKTPKLDAFNMTVSMIVFRQVYELFYNRGDLN